MVSVMSDVLRERLKKGDRWFLALVDPLLPAGKPFYIPLRRSGVKVGFLPDCDFMLPCASMGLDIASDSRRLDPEYNLNRRHPRFNWWPNVGAIGEREKEPFFIMSFEGTDDDNFSWKVSCPVGHHCRVAYVRDRMMGGGDKHFPWLDNDDTDDEYNEDPNVENPGSEVAQLEDGEAFEFIWPYWTYGAEEDSPSDPSTMQAIPPQALRFVFIEELVGENELADGGDTAVKKSQIVEPRQFMSLPVEVLARIASYLDHQAFLEGLALASRVFTSPAMKHSIPWTSLSMDRTFDALRVAEMAMPSAVRRVECPVIWDDRYSYGLYLKWKPLICQEALTYMRIYDPRLLGCTGVPPNLKELGLVAVKWESLKQFWTKLKFVPFPASTLKKLTITCQEGSFRLSTVAENGELSLDGQDLQPGDLLDPAWLALACTGVETLHLGSIPFSERNFGLIPKNSFQHLTHLVIYDLRPGFPLERMKKLFLLEIAFAPGVSLDNFVLPFGFVFDQLRSFTVRNGLESHSDRRQLPTCWLQKMPKLEYLKLVTQCYPSWTYLWEHLSSVNTTLRFLWLSRITSFHLPSIADTLSKHCPTLDELTIVECHSYSGWCRESRDAFPQGEHVTVRWHEWREIDGDKGKKLHFFSRLTDAEHHKLMKLYRCEPAEGSLMW